MVKQWAAALCVLVLAGCNGGEGKAVTCSAPEGEAALRSLLQDHATTLLRDERKPDGSPLFSGGTITAAVDSIGITFSHHRTTRDGDNSKRVDCQALLTYSIPSDRLKQTSQGVEALVPGGLDGVADRAGYRHEANTLSTEVRYALQPTDDGKAIYAEMEQAGHQAQVLQQLSAGWLVKPLLNQRSSASNSAADAVASANYAQETVVQEALPQVPQAVANAPVPTSTPTGGIAPLPPTEEIPQGAKAGFNCAKASTPTEKAICASPALSQLDGDLANAYLSIRSDISNSEREALKVSQRQWLRVRDRCQDSLCIRDQYLERFHEICSFGDHPYCKVYR